MHIANSAVNKVVLYVHQVVLHVCQAELYIDLPSSAISSIGLACSVAVCLAGKSVSTGVYRIVIDV